MPRSLALSGLWPRPEALVKATWDFDKGLRTQAQLDAAYLDATRQLVALQDRVGASERTDGNLTWQDTFRGLVDATTGYEAGGLVRLFETNKFYRQPILTGRPVLNKAKFRAFFLLDRLKSKAEKKAILPSPYWLARATHSELPAKVPDELLAARLVHDAARALESWGYTTIQFQEPLLFYEDAPDLDLAAELFRTALRGLKAATVLNFPNGNAAPHFVWATQQPAHALGIDFVETLPEDLRAPKGRLRLQAQVVDSQESLLEDEDDLADLVDRIEARLGPAHLTLTHTWDLDFLSAPVAEQKVARLAAVRRERVIA
jgi:5-methyltetrahydropteroyltriglutamate--homocysteine methyltransferase